MARNVSKRVPASTGSLPGTFGYFFRRSWLNIRQNILVHFLTVATIAISLLLLSLFLLVYVNLEGAADRWSEKVQVTAYFETEPTPAELAALQARIRTIPGTDMVGYVNKADAMQRFRNRLKGQEALLEGVGAEVLPASLEIRLKRGHRSTASVEAYVAGLKKVPGITEIQYGEEWVRRFNTFMNLLRMIGAVLGAFLVLAVIFIVSNTIKLTIFARRDELEIMKMVGATRFFIKAPFLIEGIVQGMSGALIALLSLGGFYLLFLHNAGNFLNFNVGTAGISFLPPVYLAGILVGGVAVGLLGSLASLRHFMDQ